MRLALFLSLAPALLKAQPCLPPSQARVDIGAQVVRLRSAAGVGVEYNRTTHAWRRSSGPALDSASTGKCHQRGDSIVVAPGVRLVLGDSITNGAHWMLRHDGSARDVPVKVADRLRPPPSRKRPDDESESEEPTEFSPYIASWLRDGDLVWLGLYGTDANPGNYLGGLLRYSLRTRTLASFAPPQLRDVLITSMATAGGTLWMGTESRRYDEYGPDERPGVGLVQLGRDGKFSTLSADSTPLPDNQVGAVAGAGDTLWVVGSRGVALLDARQMRWDRRFFRTVFTLDSTYVTLMEADPDSALTPQDHAREMTFLMMDLLGLGRAQRGPFLAAASRLDPEPLESMLSEWKMNADTKWAADYLRGMEPEFIATLRAPTLLPFVRQALREGTTSALPSAVLRDALPDSAWRGELRGALRTARLRGAVALAEILADSGDDAVARAWVREKLADRAVWADTTTDGEGRTSLVNLLWIAHQHPDPANLPALLDMLPLRPREAASIVDAIWVLRNGPARAAAGRRAAANPLSAIAWLGLAMNADSLLDTPAGITAKREAGETALRYIVSAGDSSGIEHGQIPWAVDAVADAQDAAAVPLLLQLIDRAWYFSEPANEGLIRLTAVEPPAGTWYDIQAKAAAFWKAWWSTNGATFKPAAPDQGMAALKRWKRRAVPRSLEGREQIVRRK